jgi:hypothetical protein
MMFGKAERPLRVSDLQKLLQGKDPNSYICLGGSVSPIDGKGAKLANRLGWNGEEITLYFEDEEKLKLD